MQERSAASRDEVEALAARMAYDAGLGVSEWEAFVRKAEKQLEVGPGKGSHAASSGERTPSVPATHAASGSPNAARVGPGKGSHAASSGERTPSVPATHAASGSPNAATVLREHLDKLALGGNHPTMVVVPREAVEKMLALDAWASRMPDAGFNDQDPRWEWWHERPR